MPNVPMLPRWIRGADHCLDSVPAGRPDGLARERACEILVVEVAAVHGVADATTALRRLLDSGWLHAVDGTVYRTGSRAD
jgi:hypothetical protein